MKKIILFFCLLISSRIYAQSAAEIHQKAIVVDTHVDVISDQLTLNSDIGKRQNFGHFDLVRAREGGLDVQVFSVWSDEKGGFALANRQIDTLNALIKRYPDKITLVKSSKELEKAVKQQRLAALVGVEGGHMIENRLDYIDSLAKRGMAYMTLTWNNSTPWATSAADESSGKTLPHKGLTDFGKEVVRRMNKLGVMVDLSHVGEQTLADAIQVSTKPVIASHSCVYALNPVSRNLKDEQIKAIAKTGGVVFVNFYSGFLDPTYQPKYEALLAKYAPEIADLTKQLGRKSKAIDKVIEQNKEEFEAIRPPLSMLIDHIDYIAKLVGVDHVGLGADYDGAESFPKQLDDVRAYPLVTEALLKRGYTIKDTEKILGGNFIRVWKANTGR